MTYFNIQTTRSKWRRKGRIHWKWRKTRIRQRGNRRRSQKPLLYLTISRAPHRIQITPIQPWQTPPLPWSPPWMTPASQALPGCLLSQSQFTSGGSHSTSHSLIHTSWPLPGSQSGCPACPLPQGHKKLAMCDLTGSVPQSWILWPTGGSTD